MANPYRDRFGKFTTKANAFYIFGRRKREQPTISERARGRREQVHLEKREIKDLLVKFRVDIEAYDGKEAQTNVQFGYGFKFLSPTSKSHIHNIMRRGGRVEDFIRRQLPSTVRFKQREFYYTNQNITGKKISPERI